MTQPTYAIAHGNTAVQAARIIAEVAAGRSEISIQSSDARPTVAPQQCGGIVDTLDAIELVAKNCMGQAGMKTIYDLVQHAKWRIDTTN